MSETPKTFLRYDRRRDVFWYPIGNGEKIPDGLHYFNSSAGRAVAWKSFYPQGAIGIRSFIAKFGSLTADQTAKDKILEVKEKRTSLDSRALTTKYADLFRVKPYPHQIEAIEYMVTYDRLALLLEQGLGKTYISLMALQLLKAAGKPYKALVICPKIVFNSWIRETGKYTDLKVLPYIGNSAARKQCRERILQEKPDIVLSTFDMLIDRDAKKGPSDQAYIDAWEGMSEQGRAAYISRIEKRGADTGLMDILRKGTTPECVAALKELPMEFRPMSLINEAQSALSNIGFFRSLEFDCLVVDEASRCLNHESARSQHIEELAQKASRVTLLSGTLCVGRPTDLFQPMRILDHTILNMNWTEFKRQYCVMSTRNKHAIVGYKNLDHLKIRTDPFILAKNRAECISLPDRIITQREYSPGTDVQRLYDAIAMGDVVSYKGHHIHVELPVVKIIKCMQVLGGFINVNDITSEVCSRCPEIMKCIAAGINPGSKLCVNEEATGMEVITYSLGTPPKLELLMEDLEDSKDEKVIVWAWYRNELTDIENALKKHKIKYIKAGDKDCDYRFENDPSIRVFLGQTAQGIGITLNSATCTIYYSHGTALEPRLQSMDRNHRIGQTKSVIVKDYVCPHTIESSVVELLEHKKEVKAFMQNVSCMNCYKYQEGKNSDCVYLQKSCVFYGDRVNAENKETLALGGFGYFTTYMKHDKFGIIDPYTGPSKIPDDLDYFE